MAKQFLSSLARRFSAFIVHNEKLLLALLSVVIVVSGTIWFRQFSANIGDGPTPGGTYVDGIVGGSAEVQSIASKLTKAGLFSFDQEGNLQNQLITDWSVDADKLKYSFELHHDVNGEEIVSSLHDNLELLGSANIELLDGGTVTIELAVPNPSLPLLLAQPLFDYGPYRVGKMTERTTVFTRNTRAKAAPAYINRIVVHSCGSESDLLEALKKRNIDGGSVPKSIELPDGYQRFEFALPRYYALVLNVNRAPFRSESSRVALFNGTLRSAFTLTVPDAEPYKSLANQLVATWQGSGVPVTLELKPLEEITSKVNPARDFQAIITGIQYGAELDPYYIWHSSQLRPPANNISGVKDERVDSLINQIRLEFNPNKRRELILQLHGMLKEQGVALFLEQEEESIVLRDTMRYQEPILPLALRDRWQAISSWSVR